MRIEIANGYNISRIIKGGWHLAGGHGTVEPEQALRDMAAFVEAGITTFDCADIYTGVEALIGRFRARYTDLAIPILRLEFRFTPNSYRIFRRWAKSMPATWNEPSTARCTASGWSGSISCNFIGGITRYPAMSTPRSSCRNYATKGRSPISGSPISTFRASPRFLAPAYPSSPCRRNIPCWMSGPRTA